MFHTMGAIIAFVLLAYFAVWSLVRVWGHFEIDPEEYHRVAGTLQRYPHLQKHLRTFREDGRITTAEMRRIVSEAQALSRRHKTRMTVEARKELILPLIEEE